MKKYSIIRILLVAVIVVGAAFVIAPTRADRLAARQEQCTQQEDNECVNSKSQSEFLIESLTRNLLGR